MSVRIPTLTIDTTPMPQFIPRSRREESSRDLVNSRNIEIRQSGPQIQQGFFRPSPSDRGNQPKNGAFFDQAGIATRNQAPISIPAPMFDPNGPKLEGNPFFDQHAASYDPRNVARELNSAVKESKMDRGVVESQRILGRGFSSRYVPQGYAETNHLDSLAAFEQLRPKIDDGIKQYRDL